MLRPTESVSLYQQIVGRGLRLSPGKSDCLVLDYAGNNFNLFAPKWGTQAPRRHRAGSGALPRLRLCQHFLGQDRRGWQGGRTLRPPLSGTV